MKTKPHSVNLNKLQCVEDTLVTFSATRGNAISRQGERNAFDQVSISKFHKQDDLFYKDEGVVKIYAYGRHRTRVICFIVKQHTGVPPDEALNKLKVNVKSHGKNY